MQRFVFVVCVSMQIVNTARVNALKSLAFNLRLMCYLTGQKLIVPSAIAATCCYITRHEFTLTFSMSNCRYASASASRRSNSDNDDDEYDVIN